MQLHKLYSSAATVEYLKLVRFHKIYCCRIRAYAEPCKICHVERYAKFLKKKPHLRCFTGFWTHLWKKYGKIMEKTCDFLPRVMRWKSEGISSHLRGSIKKVFLIILQNTPENTCAGVYRDWFGCFPANCAKFLRTPFLQNTSEKFLNFVNLKIKYLQIYKNFWLKMSSGPVIPRFFGNILRAASLTHFMPRFSFYTPWKHQKIIGFLTFSRGKESDVAWNGLRTVMNVLLLTHPEDLFNRCSSKNIFLKIYQISQGNTCVGVFF